MPVTAPPYPSFRNGETALCPLHDEAPRLFERWFSDQELVSVMGDWELLPLPHYNQTPEEYVRRVRNYTWLVCECNESRMAPIGYTGLYLQRRHRVSIVRLAIAEREYRRRGHGHRAFEMVLGWAFRSLDLFAVHATATASNEAALSLSGKVGFRVCGRYTQSRHELNGRFDEIHMELLRADWLDRAKS